MYWCSSIFIDRCYSAMNKGTKKNDAKQNITDQLYPWVVRPKLFYVFFIFLFFLDRAEDVHTAKNGRR